MEEMSEKDLKGSLGDGGTYPNLLKRDRRRWTYSGLYAKSSFQPHITYPKRVCIMFYKNLFSCYGVIE